MPQTGSADSVDVLLDVSREVEVEDVRDVRHVDTPGEKNYTFSDLGRKAQWDDLLSIAKQMRMN